MYKTRVLIISERKEHSIKYKKLIETLNQDVVITNDLSNALGIIQKQGSEFIVISDTIKEKLSEFIRKIRVLTFNSRPIIIAISKSSDLEDKLEKWNEDLKKVYNRGFWDGYYLGQRVGEWTKKYGSQATTKKTFIGTVTNYFKNISVAEIKIETGELKVGDNIYIMGTTTGVYEDTVEEIRVDLKPTEKTVKGEFCSIATKGVVRRGDKLYLVESTGIC